MAAATRPLRNYVVFGCSEAVVRFVPQFAVRKNHDCLCVWIWLTALPSSFSFILVLLSAPTASVQEFIGKLCFSQIIVQNDIRHVDSL